MTNSFDTLIPRRGSHSYKWDAAEHDDILPMWVADMDFRTAQPVMDALTKRVQLKDYLYANYEWLRAYLKAYLPALRVLPLEAMYLVWIDSRVPGVSSKELAQRILELEQLWINEGTIYGAAGEGFLRINIACAGELLVAGLHKFRKDLEHA